MISPIKTNLTPPKPNVPSSSNLNAANPSTINLTNPNTAWKKAREGRGAGKWTNYKPQGTHTNPVDLFPPVEENSTESTELHSPTESHNPTTPQPSWREATTSTEVHNKDKQPTRKPMKLVVVTPMGSRRPADTHIPPEDL